MEPVLLEKDGPIGWLVLNRPDKRNALSVEVMRRVMNRLDEIEADETIHVVILRGEGPAFCAGHDLTELVGRAYDMHQFRKVFGVCSQMMERLHRLPQPIIAQVHGIATAAGCQLVAACDLAIAEEGARFATPGVKIGLFCTTPMVPLVRIVGRRRALEMLLTGRFVTAHEAERYGLVNRVVAMESLTEEARRFAMEIAQYSRFTVGFGKRAFYSQVDMDEAAAYRFAQEAIAFNCLAEDAQEGMGAFLQRRDPQWKNR